jgi:hypothetical protein
VRGLLDCIMGLGLWVYTAVLCLLLCWGGWVGVLVSDGRTV